MHSLGRARHRHDPPDEGAAPATKGLVLNSGWRYDLIGWFHDAFSFRGRLRELRRRTLDLAQLRPGEASLDVGCGTGTLALEVARRVGPAGHVAAIDPGAAQIDRARAKAARRHLPIDFQTGVIERLPFSDQTFDVVFSTLMMHHLPTPLKRQGLAEIARVLKPGGRLVIADFKHKQDRSGRAARFRAGGTRFQALEQLLREAGFEPLETDVIEAARFSAFPGADIVRAYKR